MCRIEDNADEFWLGFSSNSALLWHESKQKDTTCLKKKKKKQQNFWLKKVQLYY